jgi:hypothetical protein
MAAMISLHEGQGPRTQSAGRGVYVVRMTVRGIQPRIWRQLHLRDTMWLSRLHEAIQIAFGWFDYQTHVFHIGDRRLGNPGQRGHAAIEDDRDVRLVELARSGTGRWAYEYCFAPGWQVDIRIEKTTAAEKGAKYPRCIDGARAGPPEDCGGLEGYRDMLICLKHPETDLGNEWRKLVGSDFDPEQCDLRAINVALRKVGR